jgi:two-component system phosphate regulon sensor histidine kinase PhoR
VSSPWRSELYWVLWLAFVGLFAGKLTSQFAIALWSCCLIYLGRHLFHINRLLLWFREGGKIPEGGGIWEEIYFLIYRLRRRNKRRKKRLIVILERFRTATAALPDATVVLGPRDEIDWFNEAAERMLGLRKSDIGQQISNLLRYPKFTQFLRQCDYKATVSVPSPASVNVQLEIRIVPYGEDLRLLVAQDVSHLRFMERVRSDFVANVSHELRTPLTVLKGYMEALIDADGAVPERYLRVFKSMEEQTTRMQNLVDDLLLLTRLESCPQPPHKQVDVPALLWEICEDAKLLDEARVAPELKVESDVDLIGVDSELRSAFSNLLVNALKYTPAGGGVVVRWREDPAVGVCLDVEDTGPGIAAEHLPRLTERFYRVEVGDEVRNKGGTGLGLAIVKHVVSRHDGELKISSELGRGSCFTCCFPEKRLIRRLPATGSDEP